MPTTVACLELRASKSLSSRVVTRPSRETKAAIPICRGGGPPADGGRGTLSKGPLLLVLPAAFARCEDLVTTTANDGDEPEDPSLQGDAWSQRKRTRQSTEQVATPL